MSNRDSVLFVHGLWMTGIESGIMRHRLSEFGYAPSSFHYPTMRDDLPGVLERLADAVRALPGTVHMVGHSLGGLVILKLLETYSDLPPGRAVLLGSPLAGSVAARAVARWPFGPSVLGPMVLAQIVAPRAPSWSGPREIGVIAGSLSAGLGRVVADLPTPNDGTVAVEETLLAGAADHVVLPVTHTGMLFSTDVVTNVAHFLEHGRFAR
ncbi:MAG: alpha/beta fold hydrolase [Gammaproteobacteria bacterium]|nr:alpha/beta fold hydrolase [Gammaproteobacteria bacterium]